MSFRTHTERFTGSGGVRLAADVAGPPDAPPVILLHGAGQTRHSWGKGLREFAAAGYRVVSVDLRGHGDSDWAANGDYAIDALAGDVAALVHAVGGRPALVGASMGGVASLVATGKDPALASSLVLVDVTPRLDMSGVARIHGFMSAHPDGFASLEEAADAIAAFNPTRPRSGSLQGIRKNLRQRPNGRWYWHWDPAFIASGRDTHGRDETVNRLSERMAGAADHIRIPTLLVRGGSSDVVSPDAVDDLRGLIAHLEYVDVAGAGHMVAGDQNDPFNAAILGFLSRHTPQSGAPAA